MEREENEEGRKKERKKRVCTTTIYLLLLYGTSLEELLLHEMALISKHTHTQADTDTHKQRKEEKNIQSFFGVRLKEWPHI